ncbi:3-isopropylmalate dehydratase small subunit [Puia sp. P3]|uniref:3-isopropylmalate dehydratase small subunit n=1 Tax=Puia sp. P3 TaxID=3423952 RepID=UPI003D6774C5
MCVVSSFFADIFKNNSLNIGILPVQVSPCFSGQDLQGYRGPIRNTQLEVNLPDQTITIPATGEQESFEINSYKKHNLTNGYDDIDYLQSMKEDIQAFAAKSVY